MTIQDIFNLVFHLLHMNVKLTSFIVSGIILMALSAVALASEPDEENSGGFISGIIEFILSLIESLLGGSEVTTTMTTTTLCSSPYIQVGLECCVDLNYNQICDRDETTTVVTTTTRVITTHRTTTVVDITEITTTTVTLIACTMNSDCGEQREVEVCYMGDVYLKRISPICKKPTTVDSYCIQLESWVGGSMMTEPSPIDDCRQGCKDGVCL